MLCSKVQHKLWLSRWRRVFRGARRPNYYTIWRGNCYKIWFKNLFTYMFSKNSSNLTMHIPIPCWSFLSNSVLLRRQTFWRGLPAVPLPADVVSKHCKSRREISPRKGSTLKENDASTMLECKTTQRRDQRALFGAERMRSPRFPPYNRCLLTGGGGVLSSGERERGRERENTIRIQAKSSHPN